MIDPRAFALSRRPGENPGVPTARVAASILSADFARLGAQVKAVEPHADMVHVDVMDAHFVPPLTIGPVVIESLRPVTGLPIHAHLMVAAPEALFEDLRAAGTDIVTFHVEAVPDPASIVKEAARMEMLPGLAVNQDTRVEETYAHLDELDNVIVMTLERTGWAGQPFVDASLRKVEALRSEVDRRGLNVDIVVDGGINEETGRRCVAAGATVLAAASSMFRAGDPAEAAQRLARAARER
jgi:ribulose-phosphate 3-epimerase